ncbi:hypothetical protein BFV94_0245 [Alteromonas macleodii]|uniref:Uncharacterized protein n=1 Tax=Alteromonas macleodii TaxID=28108 RepID=A0AB36G0I9_ALTMA|nr:hypothetical protein BFV94_0245 [Alteromonas macleodii]OES38191.1 hypothetical protein BFV95_0242 [Alteromonas macleodii]OES43184.1 hypothetical protein BFV96_0244 [Alteromonas macleodii]
MLSEPNQYRRPSLYSEVSLCLFISEFAFFYTLNYTQFKS